MSLESRLAAAERRCRPREMTVLIVRGGFGAGRAAGDNGFAAERATGEAAHVFASRAEAGARAAGCRWVTVNLDAPR
ncbi:MAG: hypothetical protein ACREE4_22480 [Stellaceae bacterium]